ncbi:rhomboid family intramembrane serine protease [Tepidibacillus sp. LV47]|uniref:rhomboid family intramembrane serine protease n=1 Tax=Tepidibacillus sp. LV47 TaxID=3398228 RepID=UPI003AAD9672
MLKDYLLSVAYQLVKTEHFSFLPFRESNMDQPFPALGLMKNEKMDLFFIHLVPVQERGFIFDEMKMDELIAHARTILSKSQARNLHYFQLYVFPFSPSIETKVKIQEYSRKIYDGNIEIYFGFADLEREEIGVPEDVFQKMKIRKDSFLYYFSDKSLLDPIAVIDEMEQIEKRRREEIKGIFHYGKPYFTYILIGINTLIYLLMEMKGGSTDPRILLQFGAKESYLITQGEYWRLIAPIFLHIGFIHFALNSTALHYLGQITERIYGSFRFFVIYLMAGIIGNMISFLFSPNSIGAGASGAIFGLFGALLYFGYVHPSLFFKTMGKDILTIIAVNLIFGLTVANIDNYAHIGGLIGGFFVSALVGLPRQKRKRFGMVIIATLFLVFTFTSTWWAIQNKEVKGSQALVIVGENALKQGDYEKALKIFQHLMGAKPKDANYHFYYAYTLDQLGNLNRAKEHYQKAIELDPTIYQAHYNIARILLLQHKEREAIPYLKKALEINPQFKEAKELLRQIQ